MVKNPAHTPTVVALVGSVLGLVFASYSTYDYVQHLDRQLHAVHCSFIPGMPAVTDAENACKAAMYSAYSAVFRESWWGGIPVSLFALGVYAFFIALCVAILIGGLKTSMRAMMFFAAASAMPLATSVIMALISAIKLGSFCKTCVGLYVSSILLAAGATWALLAVRKIRPLLTAAQPEPNAVQLLPPGHAITPVICLALLGVVTLLPAIVYVASLPDYRAKLAGCGKLPEPADTTKAMVKMVGTHPKRAMTLLVDPLCPTCKALHQRLDAEGVLENVEVSLALFPLDSTCNWMIDRSIHPGGCMLSRAVLCADQRSRETLEWMFDNQEQLAALAKSGEPLLRAKVRDRFGAEIDACIDAKATKIRLNNLLQYAVTNHIPVSTPQMYLGDQRVCDEDTDLGLRYTLGQLAPEVLR